jgi:hypothetical protein
MDDVQRMLESLAKRPQMYVFPVSFHTVQSYLHGLKAGLRHAGIHWTNEEYLAAAQECGWNARGSIGILRDFTDKGLSDDEMIRQLIAVEKVVYTRTLSRLQQQK